ncbi:ComEA family DNA-binding protein [Desulforamulus aquiferis]|uniref:ComEA family DNA-binding protein n=1 Tax=Desulforamulus aquiferis TaxID=1397668 RepID=A0AAW7ZGV8_9FIRM|nr:ComEA family DNA-binding protein [Desulforamulus aquiferis]MDO7788256.1 ComEA family DNA-binding protein [Desulforamulus aquiferis]RYD03427.1 hypothetical protein N752_19810 [Desulforamulus aquiferis]
MFTIGRREQAVILIVMAILIFTAGFKWAGRAKSSVELIPAENESLQEEQIIIHVDGAVEKPGVYRLPAGSRVNDAVIQAVALTDSDLSAVNLAAPLKDGQKIVVPYLIQDLYENWPQGDTGREGVLKAPPASSSGLININNASSLELESLPGIGPALAARIIEHRQSNGPFLSIEELKNVSGIGDKKYSSIEKLITIQ